MSDHAPSQAGGEDTPNTAATPAPDHPTPSQAEGDRDDIPDDDTDAGS